MSEVTGQWQHRKLILVVGSDPGTHDLLVRASSSHEWAVERAKDTAETLAQIQSRAYDLVVTDVNTPAADDVELLRRIHEVRPSVKVVLMTSESTPDDIVESMREHAFAYFCKPFDPAAFTEMIARALSLPAWEDGIEVLSARPEWIASARAMSDARRRPFAPLPARDEDRCAPQGAGGHRYGFPRNTPQCH